MRHYQFILFDWLLVAIPMLHCGMEELRYSTTMPGALFVMTLGPLKMPMLCVDNWDTLVQSQPFVSL